MKLGAIDPRLVSVLQALLRTKSLPAAAASAGLSTLAFTRSLGKLRGELADPVFLRRVKALAPTAQAAQLGSNLRELLDVVRDRIDPAPRFDAKASERVFRVALNDFAMVELLPGLITQLRKRAPLVRLEVERLEVSGLREMLKDGVIDLALGHLNRVPSGVRHALLLDDGHACVVRAMHAKWKARLSAAQFRAARHLVVATDDTGHALAKWMADNVPPSRIALEVPSFAEAALVLAGTDYLLTAPARVARQLAAGGALRVLPCPFDLAPVSIRAYWHEGYHRDAANHWLRDLINAL